MLASLYVRDVAIVKSLELELGDGLTVLTGETGAGKSILIDALALVLGGRADAGVLRPGAERAEVSASFALAPKSEAAAWLEAHELAADGDCVLRRVIEKDRPSKGFINGRPVPIQMLRELGEFLVDIHGQHEHQSLLRRDAQRQILDDYAGLAEPLAEVRARHDEIRAIETRLAALGEQAAERGTRLELLEHQVKELEALALKPEEIPEIEEEHSRLANGAELIEGAQSAVQALYEDDEASVSRLLARVTGRLEALAHFDARLGETVALLNEAAIRVDEAASRLHHYLDGLELDPARLQWLEARLGAVHDLARKHRVRPEELPALLARLKTELADVEDIDGNLARLEASLAQARKAYAAAARVVSRARSQAAAKLSRAVTERMQELGMSGGRFEIELAALPEGEISAHGLERVEFLVTANPGLPPRPLAKVASGGELSRISLALQVVTARLGRIPTLVFDEVDVGVGGRVAEIVGRELRTLGANRQVLCITHLPQVAALGQHHLMAAKQARDGSTVVEVRRLKNAERVQEIARMLGGVEISKKTIAHAQDMLARAAS